MKKVLIAVSILVGFSGSPCIALTEADGILLRAKSESYIERYEDAERDYKASIELESRNHMSYIGYGQFLLDRKRIDEAVKTLERGKAIAKAYRDSETFMVEKYLVKAYLAKAQIEIALKHKDTAENYLKKSLELDPDSGEAHLDYGKLLFVKGDDEAASQHLEQAIKTPFKGMTPNKWKTMEEVLQKMNNPKSSNQQ